MTDLRAAILRATALACRKYLQAGNFKTESAYNRHLWQACLDFFRDKIDAFGFIDAFIHNIREQLTRAFNEGARSVGVEPEEMTPADLDHLQSWIRSEHDHVLDLASAIQAARLDGLTLDEFRAAIRWRVDLWSNRYNEVVNEARVYFGGRQRLEWVLGPTHEHCSTCSQLAGTVAFADEWAQSGIRPQHPPNPVLECGGWQCKCELRPTDRRRTPRALEKLTAIAVTRHL